VNDVEVLLRTLVRTPSVNPRDGSGTGEAALAEVVRGWLADRGVRAELHEVLPGRPNVVAFVPGRDPRTVLLESHLDTVEVDGMTVDPYAGEVRDGRLYGRGACDAKGPLAAFLLAVAALAAGPAPPYTVVLAGVVDEEYRYRGVLHLLDKLAVGEVVGAVVGEPTDLAVATAHKGVVRYTVRTLGEAGHTSRPAEAVNAVSLMNLVLSRLDASPPTTPDHPLLGAATRCVTRIHGGTGPNIVPGRCEIDLDRRTLPGEDPLDVWRREGDELRALLPGRVEVDRPFNVDYAMDTPADRPVVAALRRALAGRGRDATVRGMPFCTDASKIARAGIPAAVFGPGSVLDAHSADESVALADVRLAAEVVVDLVHGLVVDGCA
jgi:acetylornithine deacetylase/succinyl-diaminopimelate desuccinylase-like protein